LRIKEQETHLTLQKHDDDDDDDENKEFVHQVSKKKTHYIRMHGQQNVKNITSLSRHQLRVRFDYCGGSVTRLM